MSNASRQRVYLDLTHLGRHVTGLERISIELFEKVPFEDAEVVPVRAKGVASMIFRQQVLLPLLAVLHPRAKFAFPGFPPSPLFRLCRERVYLYVHDTFLITRKNDLSRKARLYMAPQFSFAVRRLKHFLVNSEKTRNELAPLTMAGADIALYRPAVDNVFGLTPSQTAAHPEPTSKPLRLVSLGTVEPRKNYPAALAILDALQSLGHAGAQLHIIGRTGWGPDAERVARHPNVVVHGYLPPEDVRKQIESSDLYLCTSHDEGLGLPLLEAQYAGLPVIAPDQEVFREVLGRSGLFIDPAKPDAAAATISSFVRSGEWRAKARTLAAENITRWNTAAEGDARAARQLFRGKGRLTAPSVAVPAP